MFTIKPEPGLVEEAQRQIGAHIQRARKEAFRESREAFARRLGCSPVTLDRMERGEPGVAFVYILAAMQAMKVLGDVVAASSPKLLIATQVPVDFPAEFSIDPPDAHT
jgi:transcriptional regulator with XRE-family HTH domain